MKQHGVSLGLILTFGLAFSPLVPSARATWIETTAQTESIPLTLTNWGPTTSVLSGLDPFTIQQFNAATYQPSAPAGQTVQLEAVGISLSYEFQNTINMTFINPSTTTVTATGYMELSLPSVITSLVNNPTFGNSATVTSATGTVADPYKVTQPTQTTTGTSALAYEQSSSNGPAVLAAFSGAGTVSLPVVAISNSTFTNSTGNGLGGSTTNAGATLSVVYFYAYVPEPSSLVLTGLGAVGFLAVGRRRFRRQD